MVPEATLEDEIGMLAVLGLLTLVAGSGRYRRAAVPLIEYPLLAGSRILPGQDISKELNRVPCGTTEHSAFYIY